MLASLRVIYPAVTSWQDCPKRRRPVRELINNPLLRSGAVGLAGTAISPIRSVQGDPLVFRNPRNQRACHPLPRIYLYDEAQTLRCRPWHTLKSRRCGHDAKPILGTRGTVFDGNPRFTLLIDRRALSGQIDQAQRRSCQ